MQLSFQERVCTWDLTREIAVIVPVVDIGKMPETCAPVGNEAKRPSRSAK
jgi:hypothetical protein